MLHSPSEKQKKRYSRYLSEHEEIMAVTGIGHRYYFITLTFYMLLSFSPLLFMVVAANLFRRFIDSDSALVSWFSAQTWAYIFMAGGLFFGVLVLIFVMPKMVHVMVKKRSLLYFLTTRRVLIKEGIFSTKLTSAPYDKISHISVHEAFLERIIFNVGDIVIHTAGPTPVELRLYHLTHPIATKNALEELIINERHQPPMVHPTAIVNKDGKASHLRRFSP